MIWPIALSFSRRDRLLAENVAMKIRNLGLTPYCYTSFFGEEAGGLLFQKHENVYRNARLVAFFLRPTFLERTYTRFEYETVLSRPNFINCSAFIAMEDSARYLIPRGGVDISEFRKPRNRASIRIAEVLVKAILSRSS